MRSGRTKRALAADALALHAERSRWRRLVAVVLALVVGAGVAALAVAKGGW